MDLSEDPIYLKVVVALEGFRKRYLERIEKTQQRLKACEVNTEIQSKIAHELKLSAELKARLAELTKKEEGLDRICASFASGLTISDSDQQRLNNAKDMFEIGKKLTGIRFDYSAPPNVVKGYIKSESRRTLTPFEFSAEEACESLWKLIEGQGEKPIGDKENRTPN